MPTQRPSAREQERDTEGSRRDAGVLVVGVARHEERAAAEPEESACEGAVKEGVHAARFRLAASTTDPLVDKAIGQMASKLQ